MHKQPCFGPCLYMGADISDNDVIMKYLAKRNYTVLPNVSTRLYTDPSFVLDIVTNNPLSYVYISHELRYHKEIAVAAVQKYGHLLQFATDLSDNSGVVVPALQQNGMALQFASPTLQNTKDVVLKAVKQNGMALQFATDLSDNSGVVVPALQQNGMALQFASPTLQNTKDVVLKAIKQNGMALQYAGPNVSCDISGVVLYAIKQYCGIINSSKNSVDNNDDDY